MLADTIQPLPTFPEIYLAGVKALRGEIAGARNGRGVIPATTRSPESRS